MVDEWIVDMARRIGDGLGARRVLLFGSRATNTQSRRSDLDLFIEAETDLRPLDRIGRALDLAGKAPCPIDVIVYTPREIERASHSKFVQRVLREGVVVYEHRQAS